MKTEEDAKELAHAMVRIGNNVGRQTMVHYFRYVTTTWFCNW